MTFTATPFPKDHPVVQIEGLVEIDNHIELPAAGQEPQFWGVYVREEEPQPDDVHLWRWKQDFGTRESAIAYAQALADELGGDWYETFS